MKRSILMGLLVLTLAAVFMVSCGGGGSSSAAAPARTQAAAPVMDASGLPRFDAFPRPKMSPDGRKLSIAYLYGTIDMEDDLRMMEWINIEAYNRGWECHNMEVKTDEGLIRTAWLTANNMPVDAVILPGMPQMDSKIDLIEASRNAGIGVYGWDCMSLPGIIFNITTPAAVGAVEMFYTVASDMNWEGNFTITTAYNWPNIYERSEVVRVLLNPAIYPGLRFLEEQSVDFSSPIALQEQCYIFGQVWLQKYGYDMNCIFVIADPDAVMVNEACKAAGRKKEDLIIWTMGGNTNVIAMMRDDPDCLIQYEYLSSLEDLIHRTIEIVDEIQVQGLTPGDGRCSIDAAGKTTFISGQIITMDNLPPSGAALLSVFDWYNPDDTEAWYNWRAPNYPYEYAW